jgi:hypothetical protein
MVGLLKQTPDSSTPAFFGPSSRALPDHVKTGELPNLTLPTPRQRELADDGHEIVDRVSGHDIVDNWSLTTE